MIVLLQFDNDKNLTGWIIASDLDDARRQAQETWKPHLAGKLYTMPPDFMLTTGKHEIGPDPDDPMRHLVMLVR